MRAAKRESLRHTPQETFTEEVLKKSKHLQIQCAHVTFTIFNTGEKNKESLVPTPSARRELLVLDIISLNLMVYTSNSMLVHMQFAPCSPS